MTGMVRTAVGTAAHLIADAINIEPETRRAQEAAATEAAAQRLVTPAAGDDDGDDLPAPVALSPRQAKTRAAVERLISAKLT